MTDAPAGAPSGDGNVQPKTKFKPSPEAVETTNKMLKREGFWLPLSMFLFFCNYTVFRLFPEGMTFWRTTQIVVIALILLGLSIYLIWTQLNAIEVATRDDTVFDDQQASNDMGWTYYAFFTFFLMCGIAVLGFVISITAPEWPSWIHRNMYLSWPIIFYTPFWYALTVIDRKVISWLYQRIVSLKMRITRLEQSH